MLVGNRERVSSAVAVTALHMHAQSHFQGQLAEEAESGADPESMGGEKSNVNIKESREREIQPPCERTTSATVALNREGAGTAIKVIRLSTRENGRAGCWPKGPHVKLLNQ